MEVLEQIFLNYLEASLTGTILILVVFCIFKVFNKHINVRTKHILCFLILIRFIVPIHPYINFVNIIDDFNNSINVQQYEDIEFKEKSYKNTPKSSIVYEFDKDKINANNAENSVGNIEKDIEDSNSINIIYISALVWSFGFTIILLMFNLSFIQFKRLSKSAERIQNNQIEDYIYDLSRRENLKKNISIYVCNKINSPFIIGMIRPKIYLPEYILNLEQDMIKHVLLHEFMHYKRKDLYINFLSGISLALHWFNPFVWVMVRKIKNYREYACDLSVLESLGEENIVDYGMTIINLSKIVTNKKSIQLGLGFERNNKIKERIEMIKKFRRGSYKISITAVLGCLVLTAVAFTSGIKVNALNVENKVNTNINSETENSVAENINERHEFLIDSDIKNYKDINKVESLSKFPFKVPDFTLGKIVYNIQLIQLDNNKQLIKIDFIDQDGYSDYKNSFKLQIFDSDPIESLKKSSEMELKSVSSRYGVETDEILPVEIEEDSDQGAKLNGQYLTVRIQYSDDMIKNEKYYVWKNEGIYYGIRYCRSLIERGDEKVYNDVSLNDVEKIANSLSDLDKVNNEAYESRFAQDDIVYIYDDDDLKNSEKLLGFNPKIQINLNENIKINSCRIQNRQDSYNNKYYELSSAYTCGNGTAVLDQSNTIDYINWFNFDDTEIINLSGRDILRHRQNYKDDESGKERIQSMYFWNDNGIYYSFEVWDAVDEEENILREFINNM